MSLNCSCVVERLLPEDEEVRGTLHPYHVAGTTFHSCNKSPPVRLFNLEATSCTLQNNETKMFLYTHEHSTCLDLYLT